MYIHEDLESNIKYLKEVFADCMDIVMREMDIGEKHIAVFMIYIDSMIDRDLVEGVFLKNLMFDADNIPPNKTFNYLKTKALATADLQMLSDMESVIDQILSGNTGLFVQGSGEAFVIASKDLPSRGVNEATSEVAVRGPKDSFTESMRINTILIRRRIRDTKLKTKQLKLGVRSKTDVTIMYMEDIVRTEILENVSKRLESFEIDGVLDCGTIEQLTEKDWYSPFPQYQATQRPDKAASAALEGRIVLIVDNSPEVLLLPTTLNCFFQASDDYYNRWLSVNFVRIIRYFAAFLAMALPGIYIAVATFHPEMLPTSLELSFAASRQGVPFLLWVEVLLMELAFELLREAGIRLPGPMGSALGIVGGLIIGQAAVDANIVSPIVVIIVALTALCAFTIPNDSFASAFRLIKFYLIFLSAVLGMLGLVAGIISVLVHLCGLKSFGIPYMMPYVSVSVNNSNDKEDGILRVPLFKMIMRPVFANKSQKKRLKMKNQGKE